MSGQGRCCENGRDGLTPEDADQDSAARDQDCACEVSNATDDGTVSSARGGQYGADQARTCDELNRELIPEDDAREERVGDERDRPDRTEDRERERADLEDRA